MNIKEIAEIRRRFRFEDGNVNYVRGAFVNDGKEIIAEFNQFLGSMSDGEAGAILSLIKKVLSGTPGKNLIDVSFTTKQVNEGDEHKLLIAMRNEELKNDDSVHAFYKKVIESVDIKENFLILLAYDVFQKRGDGEDGESTEIFKYIVCAVCPIKSTKSALSYLVFENKLKNISETTVVGAPEMGFMFPAFDDRKTNIYNALYYTRSASESHEEFVNSAMAAKIPMPAKAQKASLSSILSDTVGEDLSYSLVNSIEEESRRIIEGHKEQHDFDTPVISKETIGDVLRCADVDVDKIDAFKEKYTETFGRDALIPVKNVMAGASLEVKTPEVAIKIANDKTDLVKTQIIDGVKYVLINAEGGVTVNGVEITVK